MKVNWHNLAAIFTDVLLYYKQHQLQHTEQHIHSNASGYVNKSILGKVNTRAWHLSNVSLTVPWDTAGHLKAKPVWLALHVLSKETWAPSRIAGLGLRTHSEAPELLGGVSFW